MPSMKTALKKNLWWSQKYNICLEMWWPESQKCQIKTKNKKLKKSTDTQEIYLSTVNVLIHCPPPAANDLI